MEFGENWEHIRGSRVREGYFASTHISFKVSDLEKYERLWIGLSEIANVSVDGVWYDYSKKISVQNETRKVFLDC